MKLKKVYGIYAARALLQQKDAKVSKLLLQKTDNKRVAEIYKLAISRGSVEIEYAKSSKLDELTDNAVHQGVIIYYTASQSQLDLYDLIASKSGSVLVLILDGVVDPSNLGACIRSAAAFNVDAVIIPKDKAVAVNETVRKVAAGGADMVPVYPVTNLVRTMDGLADHGIWFYGLTEKADQTISEMNFSGNIGIVMGGEEKGMRDLTAKKCDHLIKLPTSDDFSTLNVSVATGITLYEVKRQLG